MIKLLKLILTRQGFNVIGALGGEQGLQVVADVKPDLILLDLMMPGLSGWAVYQTLRSSPDNRQTPVIIITAKAQTADDLIKFQEAGISATITKPFRPQELIETVRRVLELAPE